MLNKKEKADLIEFLSVVTDVARELLDEIAVFEAVLDENEKEQKRQSALRKERAKRLRRRRKLA